MQEGCQGQSVPLWACVREEGEEEKKGKEEENGLNRFRQCWSPPPLSPGHHLWRAAVECWVRNYNCGVLLGSCFGGTRKETNIQ